MLVWVFVFIIVVGEFVEEVDLVEYWFDVVYLEYYLLDCFVVVCEIFWD